MNPDDITAETRSLEDEQDPARREAALERLARALGPEDLRQVIANVLTHVPEDTREALREQEFKAMLRPAIEGLAISDRRAMYQLLYDAGGNIFHALYAYEDSLLTIDHEEHLRECPSCGEAVGPDEDPMDKLFTLWGVGTLTAENGMYRVGDEPTWFVECNLCGKDHYYTGDLL